MEEQNPNAIAYSAALETGERPTVRICSAETGEVFAFQLLTRDDAQRFVDLLNENQIEAVHVKDCFHDFLFELYGNP